jgi:hypothetical protein
VVNIVLSRTMMYHIAVIKKEWYPCFSKMSISCTENRDLSGERCRFKQSQTRDSYGIVVHITSLPCVQVFKIAVGRCEHWFAECSLSNRS